jgi:hypothetical protein
MTTHRETIHKSGRYSHAGGLASIDLPREGKRAGGKIEVVHGVAPDPYFAKDGERRGRGKFEVLGQRQQRVAINRKADAIELELSYGRISQAAADAARAYQRVVESSRKAAGASNWEQGSGGGDHDAAIASRLDRAAVLVEWMASVCRIVGPWRALIVGLAVDDRMMIGEISHRLGGRGWRARAKVAGDFRSALEEISEEWERRGFPTA